MKRAYIPVVVLWWAVPLYADVASSIKGGFASLGNTIYHEVIKPGASAVYSAVAKPVDTATERVEACAIMVGLGTEWAAKQAALATKQAALDAAHTSAESVAFIAQQLEKFGTKIFNVQKASFEVRGSEVARAHLVTMQVSGVFFGKFMAFDVPFDMADMGATLKNMFEQILKNSGS